MHHCNSIIASILFFVSTSSYAGEYVVLLTQDLGRTARGSASPSNA